MQGLVQWFLTNDVHQNPLYILSHSYVWGPLCRSWEGVAEKYKMEIYKYIHICICVLYTYIQYKYICVVCVYTHYTNGVMNFLSTMEEIIASTNILQTMLETVTVFYKRRAATSNVHSLCSCFLFVCLFGWLVVLQRLNGDLMFLPSEEPLA